MIRRVSVGGHEVIELCSERLTVSIDVTRGAHIHSLIERESGIEVLHQDPRGLAAHEVGGWFELFPNAGPASGGQPMHGDVRDLPWRVVSESSGVRGASVELAVRSMCLPAAITKTIALRDDVMTVTERVENLADEPVRYLWGQHLTLGKGILGSQTLIDAPHGRYWEGVRSGARERAVDKLGAIKDADGTARDLDRYPSAPAIAMVFADQLVRSEVTVRSPLLALSMEWDHGAFPALWLWYENRGTLESPFDGRMVALGVEPQVSATPGLAEAVADGSAAKLGPRATTSCWVRIQLNSISHMRTTAVT